MKQLVAIIFLITSMPIFAQNEGSMDSYQSDILQRRVSEAEVLWIEMKHGGFTETTVVALDFTFFSNDENGSNDLVKSLSENYQTEISPANEDGYYLIKGSTRPYGNEFTKEQWLGWVDFMVSIGFSNNAVFSTWSVFDPKSKKTWSSENIEVE